MKSVKLFAIAIILLNITSFDLDAQERFEIISDNQSHTVSIVKVAEQSQLKPFIVDIIFELEPKGKEKKKNKKMTNVLSCEINQLDEIWIYGTGDLDGHYGFNTKINDDRSLSVNWFPTALPSKYTIPAPLKEAFLNIKYRGKNEANFEIKKTGSFKIKYFNTAGVNEYSYVFNYSEKRTMRIELIRTGNKLNLNPSSVNKSSKSDILGQILKIKTRNIE
ncbi:MAG TPA: hypothetical protein PKD90_05975 [Phnomibacter sp.]|nr:hypothetical protein [Phnomibacter sp.]